MKKKKWKTGGCPQCYKANLIQEQIHKTFALPKIFTLLIATEALMTEVQAAG